MSIEEAVGMIMEEEEEERRSTVKGEGSRETREEGKKRKEEDEEATISKNAAKRIKAEAKTKGEHEVKEVEKQERQKWRERQ